MEIIRKAPFPLTFTYSGLDATTDYVVSIMNDDTADLVEIPVTSDGFGDIDTPLPDYFSRYDAEYVVEIYLQDGLDGDSMPILGDLVASDTLAIARQYFDPSTLIDAPEDLADANEYEALVRAIINSITDGFKYERSIVETTGMGSDYMPISEKINKVIRVYENDVLVYDAEPTDPEWTNTKTYYVSPDRTAITVAATGNGGYNRHQSRPLRTWRAGSDSFDSYDSDEGNRHGIYLDPTYAFFPMGWDYVFVIDTGYAFIPSDIKMAATMLYNDLTCNNLPHLNSYIKDYKSAQYELKFNEMAFSKTGNRMVDQILENYTFNFPRLGVV